MTGSRVQVAILAVLNRVLVLRYRHHLAGYALALYDLCAISRMGSNCRVFGVDWVACAFTASRSERLRAAPTPHPRSLPPSPCSPVQQRHEEADFAHIQSLRMYSPLHSHVHMVNRRSCILHLSYSMLISDSLLPFFLYLSFERVPPTHRA